ncbi:DUF1990 domain-containing protein (plasmid) [Rhodococcus aetherivorans]|nr:MULTISPECIES: DUF1990 domain-containing protein [Rhodococcus]WKX01804.1 DUF1990 domain-containing protein [Rhodococcus aetherivorans]
MWTRRVRWLLSSTNPRRPGFAYGTLDGHPEQGEELFCLEWRDDDTVLLVIVAFSRPAVWWSRTVAPLARWVQHRLTDQYLHALVPRTRGA